MKGLKRTTTTALLAVAMMLASSCCRSGGDKGVVNPIDAKRGDVTFTANISGISTRVTNEVEWEAGDAIGVYAVKAGQTPAVANLHQSFGNVKYTTADKQGKFVAAATGITFPDAGALDFVAYYPYNSAMDGKVELAFNNADQSDLSKLDLLYSNNAKNKNKTESSVALNFEHKLVMLVLDINSNGQAIGSDAQVKLEDVLVDGTLNLANGTVTTGATKAAPTVKMTEVAAGQRYRATFILPPQSLTGKKLVFTIGGKTMEENLPATEATESNYKWTIPVTYKATTGEITLAVSGATIAPWKEGATPSTPIVITPEGGSTGGSTPAPAPAPSPSPAPSPTPGAAKLLFPAANFNDWTAFTQSVNSKYPIAHTEHNASGGRDGSGAAHIKGNPPAKNNPYLFTVLVPENFEGANAKSISFYIKGTSPAKSISINVYNTNSEIVMKRGYVCYNLDVVTQDVTLKASPDNSYKGKVELNDWVKVTLLLENEDGKQVKLPTTAGKPLIAFKIGYGSDYDVLIDDITFE